MIFKCYPLVFFVICIFSFTFSYSQSSHHVIPLPVSIRTSPGMLKLVDLKLLIIPKKNEEYRKIAELYKESLGLSNVKIVESNKPSSGKVKSIVFVNLNEERKTDYHAIHITKNGIVIHSTNAKGAFYALQTILQLELDRTIPFNIIEDYAAFSYRGMHLDVSRHFYPVSFIKQYLDLLARYKFNTFHWHLTDDQGWRIEIKKFPDLVEIGSRRKETLIGAYGSFPVQYDHTEYGGYYSQDEIREVVQYAADRFIDVIPEIEMPGHSAALLASYPQFGCSGGPYSVATSWGVKNNVICPTDTSIWFMKSILEEVCELFPGKFIHIGGDEVLKEEWKNNEDCNKIIRRQNLKSLDELQSYFIRQIDSYLTSKGKTLVGWDEILDGGLAQNAVVMSWRGMDGGIKAAKQKHFVIFTPGSHCYFDHYQSLSPKEPLAIGGYTNLEKVYSFNPIPEDLAPEFKKYILGAQGNVWTEYIPTSEQVLYMAFPRAIALAEVNWTPSTQRNYPDFLKRLNPHFQWFKMRNINLSNAYLDIQYKTYSADSGVIMQFLKAPVAGKILMETSSKEEGISQSYLQQDSIFLEKNIDFKAWFQLPDNTLGRSLSLEYKHHKFAGKKITFTQNPADKYSKGGFESIINGIDAPLQKFSGPEWLGFDSGKNMEAVINLGKSDSISKISIQLFQEESSWIYLPSSIEIYSSNDNINFSLVDKQNVGIHPGRGIVFTMDLANRMGGQFVKILIKNYGQIETDKIGGGHGAWLFVGEISAE